MTQARFVFDQVSTIVTEESSEEQELGKLDLDVKQEVRSWAIPETNTLMRRVVFSKSAALVTEKKEELKKEIDDKFVQWIGRVLEINGDSFIARIDPIRQQSNSKIAKFNVNKVKVLNGDQMEEGATFYWTVGLFRNDKGTYRKRSEVRFRLPITPNKQAVDELALIKAQELFDGIGWLE